MTPSDQDGQHQLTRKQLREIRLTGSTPVITEAEAAAASQLAGVLPRAAEPVEIAPVDDVEVAESDAPLTRRQMRALERAHSTADDRDAAEQPEGVEPDGVEPGGVEPQPVTSQPVAPEAPVASEPVPPVAEEQLTGGLVSGVPAFDPAPAPTIAETPRFDASRPGQDDAQLADAARESDVAVEPGASDRDQVAAIFGAPVENDSQPGEASVTESETVSDEEPDELEVITAERPVVGAAFGLGVKPEKPVGALFDDLLEGRSSSGSHHSASTALIFTPSAGAGSLSGPIASTGELLITGTYALPDGIGSQGHAHGTADGRDADAVLLDGELAPASSPTPIAASSAVSTSKSAGEVIRPPAPDKGNKLMLTLAIVAGGLALALAATLIIASTTGVFG